MPLGNSVTELHQGSSSYRCWMWKELADSGFCFNLVGSRTGVWLSPPRGQTQSACPYEAFDENHEGHYGWCADELLYGATRPLFAYPGTLSEWLPVNTPDIVLLHIGTNDIDLGHGAHATANETGFIIDTLNGLIPGVIAAKQSQTSPLHVVDQHSASIRQPT